VPTLRALWARGTKPAAGLPETTCYPRPVGSLPIIVGGTGRRVLRLAATLGDACNVPADRVPEVIAATGEQRHVTVLDVPVLGDDREHVATLVERLRGRTAAATFAARHHAGTAAEHVRRYRSLAEAGVCTAFVALLCTQGQPPSGIGSWGAGFLPSRYQGVEFRGVGDPVLFIANPPGVSQDDQRATIDAVNSLNTMTHERTHDPEVETRIAQYELAFRMQMSVPEATDIWREPPEIHEMYGTTPGKLSFANQCLLARRLTERGVRFVQLFDPGWDDHSGIFSMLPVHCREVDRAMAALVRDLKQRGLLDDTLVVWATEFGRTPMAQDKNEGGTRAAVGRDHQRDAFTIWMAGGGVKRGFIYGETDELGASVVANPVHVHDFNATLLHLLGVDHKRLTYRHQGREFRVTDVSGEVVHDLIA